MRSKHLNKLVLKMLKQINILTQENLYCVSTTGFSGVVGRVVDSTAPASLIIKVSGKSKNMIWNVQNIPR